MSKEIKNIEVALGCVVDGSKVLLTKRSEKDIPNIHGMWELPGGKVEFNEMPERAVIRELYEETGAKVEIVESVPFHFTIDRNFPEFKLNIILNCYICRLSSEVDNFINNDIKIAEIKWFEFKDIEFLKVMAGSREFLHWILKSISKIDLQTLYNPEFGFILFENIDNRNNHRKKYQITIYFEPNAAKDELYTLSCQYGKIDGKVKTQNDYFKTEFDLHSELLKRSNDRIAHGYNIIQFGNFPLKDWILQNSKFISPSKHIQQKINFGS